MISRQYKKSTSWPEVLVRHSPEAAEAIANFLFEQGAAALIQDVDPKRPDTWFTQAGFDPDRISKEVPEALAGFLDRLGDIFTSNYRPEAEWRETSVGDWAEKWKEGLHPLEVGPNLVIKPTWHPYPALSGQVIIEIDPGLAFGTGHHETTYMCLDILAEFVRSSPTPDLRILDVGTGSGILALAAAGLGAGHVTAIDNDPEVMPIASANLHLNRLADRVQILTAAPADMVGSFDLILANLTRNDLIGLASEFHRLAGKDSTLVLSGILIDQLPEITACYLHHGFRFIGHKARGEWAALILRAGEPGA